MAALPCRNENCKSFGKPHPNCRCYGGMKDGGEVKHFCSENRAHDENCKYFAAGGEASDIPPPPPGFSITTNQADSAASSESTPPPPPPGFTIDQENRAAPSPPAGFTIDDHSTDKEKALTAAEGFAQGILGPAESLAAKAGEYFPKESMVPLGEKEFGFTPEDIRAREEANPEIALAGKAAGLVTGAITGAGVVGAASKAGMAAAHAAELGKIGSGVISNLVSNGLIQGGDEVHNWLLGKGDTADAVGASLANVTAASLIGAAGGLVSASGEKLVGALSGTKFIDKIQGFLTGLGAGAKATYEPQAVNAAEQSGLLSNSVVKDAYHTGKHLFTQLLTNPLLMGEGIATYEGYREGGYEQALKNYALSELGRKGLSVASEKVIVPVLTKAMESGTLKGIGNAVQYGINVAQGNNLIEKGVDSVLKTGTSPTINYFRSEEERLRKRNELDQEISNGGINQEIQEQQQPQMPMNPFGLAEGGMVDDSTSKGTINPLASFQTPPKTQPKQRGIDQVALSAHYPDQAIMLGVAKSRVSNYLNSLRPVAQQPGPLFDDPPDQTMSKKTYHSALDIANRPLSILEDVRKGTLEPDQVKHFQAMYPEMNQLLQKKLTQKMVDGKMGNQKPPYVVRQGLSLLLGAPLSSDLSPQNIQAAQATFATKLNASQQGAPVTSNKKNTSSLSKVSGNFTTPNQARLKEKQLGD